MEIYEDLHCEEHYHLGDEYEQPNKQNKIYDKIIKRLKQNLPKEYSIEYIQEGNITFTKSFRIREKRRQVLFMNCYKYRGSIPPKWRIKIIQMDRDFFNNIFLPLIREI